MSGLVQMPLSMIQNAHRGATARDVATVFHEAGHAVVAAVLGWRVDAVTIDRPDERGFVAGRCVCTEPDWELPGRLGVQRGLFAAAGAASTAFLDGAILTRAEARDREAVRALDRELMDDAYRAVYPAGHAAESRAAFEHESRAAAEAVLGRNVRALDRLAEALLRHRRLSRTEVYAVLGLSVPDVGDGAGVDEAVR